MKVNIFSPTYHRFRKTKIAVESIIESVHKSIHDVKYHILDNNSPQEMKDWLLTLNSDKVEVVLHNSNLGKAKSVNLAYSKARECDYMVSVDSDMWNVHTDYVWIDEMVDILNSAPIIGLLSAFQEGASCHHLHALAQNIDIKFPDKLHKVAHGSFGAVAGGCMMMRSKEWELIDGYSVMDVYNADDALIMRKTHELLRKICGVSSTVALQHMVNDPEEKDYQQWKINKCRGIIPNDRNGKGFFDK